MKYILTARQMQECDANTMEAGFGIPSAVLMERAALAVTEEIMAVCPDPSAAILVACGTGNNGGDGLAIARLLYRKGYDVTVLFPGKEEKCSAECARQLGILRKYAANTSRLRITGKMPALNPDLTVDALFGIGLARNLGGIWREIVDKLNTVQGPKVSVDIPSGISADTGKVMGTAFDADFTVTFGFAKIGQILYPGASYCGKLIVKDMGIDEASFSDGEHAVRSAEPSDLSALPKRDDDSNKGTYGKLLIFAGSYNMAGAAAFASKAAYRSGAGLVRVATDSANREIIQSLVPEAILSTYDAKTDMRSFVEEQVSWADAVVLGPGIGQSRQAEEMVQCVLETAQIPCLIDADGLNLLSAHPEWAQGSRYVKKGSVPELIVTPHPGEMARLLHTTVDAVKDDLIAAARELAGRLHAVTVLKDAHTVLCIPASSEKDASAEGDIWINRTGNNGMATAGSGDVLAGVIGALLGQGVSAAKAAILGVMIHGMAGDAAASVIGKTSLMASDLTDAICNVFRKESVK